jgi:hypothetical protein
MDMETLRILYQDHQTQIRERRQKIHGIADRAVTILLSLQDGS